MEKKLYIPPFTEVIKPVERTPLLSGGSGQTPISDEFIDDGEGGDAKGYDGEYDGSMHDDLWGSVSWD